VSRVGLAVNPSPPDEPEARCWSVDDDAAIAEAARRIEALTAAKAEQVAA
jgi:hypothetical protein